MSIIEFKKENLKVVHFFVEHLDFPVAVATYNEWEEQQICYLEKHYECFKMNTESICKWCINHRFNYQIIYPINKIFIIKNPYKYLKYLQLKRKLISFKKLGWNFLIPPYPWIYMKFQNKKILKFELDFRRNLISHRHSPSFFQSPPGSDFICEIPKQNFWKFHVDFYAISQNVRLCSIFERVDCARLIMVTWRTCSIIIFYQQRSAHISARYISDIMQLCGFECSKT